MGDFLIVDNDATSMGPIYQDVLYPAGSSAPSPSISLPAGCYHFSLDAVHRFGLAATTTPPPVPIDLAIHLGGIHIGNIHIPVNNPGSWVWNTWGFDFILPAPVSDIQIHQISSGLNGDYAIDNIRIDPQCGAVPDVAIDYCVDGCEYCFGVTPGTAPCISSYSYSWDMGDGSSYTGTNPCHTYTSDGLFNVCVDVTAYDASGGVCSTWTECKKVYVEGCDPSSLRTAPASEPVEETAPQSRPAPMGAASPVDLQLSPNPTDGIVAMRHGFAGEGNLNLQVLSLEGKVVLERNISAAEGEKVLDVSALPAGMYQVLLQDAKGNRAVRKLAKE